MPVSRGSVGLIWAVHSTPASPRRKLGRIDSGAVSGMGQAGASATPASSISWSSAGHGCFSWFDVGGGVSISAGLPLPETGSSTSPLSPSPLVSNSGWGGSIGLVSPSSVASSLSSMKLSLPNSGGGRRFVLDQRDFVLDARRRGEARREGRLGRLDRRRKARSAGSR